MWQLWRKKGYNITFKCETDMYVWKKGKWGSMPARKVADLMRNECGVSIRSRTQVDIYWASNIVLPCPGS
jgi:hypothetical protein